MFGFLKFIFPKPQPTIADVVVDVSGGDDFDTNSDDFDVLREALEATGLLDAVDDRNADLTVFAPTDAAFTELAVSLGFSGDRADEAAVFAFIADATGFQSADDPGLLDDVLLYHVSPEGQSVEELQAAGTVQTLEGGTITVDGTELIDADPDLENPELIDGLTDITAANGTVQAIDRVLLPLDLQEAIAQPSIADVVVQVSGASGFDDNGGDFDILRDALVATDLLGAVADRAADVTVFAPTDAAFTELAVTLGFDGDTADEAAVFGFIADATGFVSADDPGILDDVLLYHVSPESRSVEALQQAGTVDTLLAGAQVTVDGTELIDNDDDVENPEFVTGVTDIEAVNGTIQAIDRVLLPIDLDEAVPQPTIVDIVVATSGAAGFDDNGADFDILRDALVATELLDVVADPDADFTVFAPTDAAFAQLAVDLGFDGDASDEGAVFGFIAGATGFQSADDPGLLDDVLLYHVAPDGRDVAALQADGVIQTAEGGTLTVQGVTLVDNDPSVKDPKLVDGATDIEASNGVVQAIDRVLLPLDLEEPTPDFQPIFGSFRSDHITGTGGSDEILGFFGRDRLSGGDDDDLLNGGAGRDRLFGDAGDDTLLGRSGRDQLFGGTGDDTLSGGLGRDTLSGGDGDDWLTGGLGRDTFDFSHLDGHDTVTDFGPRDWLVFDSDRFADADAVLAATSNQGAGAFIESDDGTVFLVGIDAAHLNDNDFLFV